MGAKYNSNRKEPIQKKKENAWYICKDEGFTVYILQIEEHIFFYISKVSSLYHSAATVANFCEEII